MFTKILILVLLGTSVVLANPVNSVDNIQNDLSWKERLTGWFRSFGDKAKEYYQQGKDSLDAAFENIKQQSKKILNSDAFAKVTQQFKEMKAKMVETLAAKWKAWESTFKGLKQKVDKASGDGKKQLLALQEKAQQALEKEKSNFVAKLNEWKEKILKKIKSDKGHQE